jgi:ribosomal protein L11 methyltransferase
VVERWVCVEVDVGPADVDPASGMLWLAGATAVAERPDGTSVTLVAGFDDDTRAEAAIADVGARWPARRVVVDDDSWLDAWKPWARPSRVGRILIVPHWLPTEAPPGVQVVSLDPGRAFGSGSHPSTRLVLRFLDRGPVAGAAVLDVGCGSGVLAVAAALLGADRVVGVDVDPEAVTATRANAARHGVAHAVTASTTPVGEVDGHFDVVVANIGVAVLTELSAGIARRVAPGGRLVLSGLLTGQWRAVVSSYPGLEVVEVAEEGGWAAPLLLARER